MFEHEIRKTYVFKTKSLKVPNGFNEY